MCFWHQIGRRKHNENADQDQKFITFRTLFHLGQLLHLGLQQTRQSFRASFGLIMHVTAFSFLRSGDERRA